MLNSVAKYLWGSSSEAEQGPVQADAKDQGLEQQQDPGQAATALVAEQLATHHDEDDDWVLVGLAGQDKENNSQCFQNSSHEHHQHQQSHHLHHPSNHNQHHLLSAQPFQAEGNSSLSQNSSCSANYSAGGEEALDDAASLSHTVGCCSEVSGPGGDGLDGPANLDLDSNYSSDTESSPESVFSACSGRSHATYHPRGSSSEPWVIAPPPCFTGSQVGTLSPVAASPLENLLIEHPSMSVYLSVPPSALPASHPYLSAQPPSPGEPAATGSSDEMRQPSGVEAGAATDASMVETLPVIYRENLGDASPAYQARPTGSRGTPRNRGLVHHEAASLEEVARTTRAAQQQQCFKAQKMITTQRCDRQNKVRDFKSHPKGKSNNRRNKHLHASGAKFTRFSQRV